MGPAKQKAFRRRKAFASNPEVSRSSDPHAALSHMDVSKALHIIGMFMPKFGFGFALVLLSTGFTSGATSVARSQEPCS
ncbi:hypothetical protein ACQ859_00560 [Roseateles chitinivorans]|uniref:hypothetical protein n=1 Tax=Roseateles chitinivorans TaxID=2917965 RepID=UPI003D6660A7